MQSWMELVEWPQPAIELAGFVAAFLSIGAIGFWNVVLRSRAVRSDADAAAVIDSAARRAAALGLFGVVLGAVMLGADLPGTAAERHTTVGQLLRTNRVLQVQIAMEALAFVGFLLALGRSAVGWWLATLGVVIGMLRGIISGRVDRLVNPIHMLAGGLWIGTLFVMLAAGLTSVFQPGVPADRRGRIAANMVNAFSPFALGFAAVLAVFGVITATLHLKYWAALWTTPYGITFLVKLATVLGVLSLGAWNWRRMRPRLGAEDAAHALRRSASWEVLAATVVLVITAVLVSLPTPKLPGH